MASRIKPLATRIVEKLLPRAYEKAQPQVKLASETLGRELFDTPVTTDGNSAKGSLRLLQFWATILHDGRGTVRPKSAPLLIWFRNPKDDPRLKNGYPTRLSDVQRLSHEDFKKFSKLNKKAEAAGGLGPMIVAKQSKGTTGKPFFSNDAGGGMQGFLDSQRPMIKQEMSDYVNELLVNSNVKEITGKVSL